MASEIGSDQESADWASGDVVDGRSSVVALVVVALLAPVLVVLGPAASPAYGCDCSAPSDAEAFESSDAVFVGEVVRVDPPPRAAVMSSADPAIWVFEVSEVYKGEVSARQEIVSEVSGASCGLEIPNHGEFLVFGTTEGWRLVVGEGQYYAGMCGGTRPTAEGPFAVEGVVASPPLPAPEFHPFESPDPGSSRAALGAATGFDPADSSSTRSLPAVVALGALAMFVVAGLVAVGIARRRSPGRAHH